MENRFLIVNGHPDPSARRFCAALCDAYAAGVQSCGWRTDRLDAGAVLASLPRRLQETADLSLSGAAGALSRIRAADLVAIVFPLWLGSAPHALQQMFESIATAAEWPRSTIAAHLVVTMDMPAFLYRPRSRTASEARSQFYLQGVRACEVTLIGGVNVISQEDRERRLVEMQAIAASVVERNMSARRRSVFGWRLPATFFGRPPDPVSRHVAGALPQH